jgi:hypothetical protein
MKYWFNGSPFAGVATADDFGSVKFWASGSPAPFLPPAVLALGAAEMDGAASVAVVGQLNVPGAAEMDGVASFDPAGNTLYYVGPAQMDGVALVQFTTGVVVQGYAQMDGAASMAASSILIQAGAANMDGAASASFGSSFNVVGAAQMDGLGHFDAISAIASGHAQMDGLVDVNIIGRVTGGYPDGAAEMDGRTNVFFTGQAALQRPTTAQMDGHASMLAVQAGNPLPPHGIILSAGI